MIKENLSNYNTNVLILKTKSFINIIKRNDHKKKLIYILIFYSKMDIFCLLNKAENNFCD